MSCIPRAARVLLLMAALVLTPHRAQAGTGGSFYLPLGVPQQTYAGLMIKVDTDWAQGYGYRPVRLELIASQPASEDRSLTIEVSLNDFSNRSVIASTVVTLPAGSRNVVQWVPVPQLANDQMLSVRTFVGGREIEDLSTERFSIGSGQYWAADSGIPRTLFVADSPPNVSGFKFFGTQPYLPYGNTSFGKPQDVAAFTHLKAGDLFDESIYYSALDMIFMSRSDADGLAAKAPKVWQALNSWVRSGGVLVLHGADHDDAALAEVEQLLKAPASSRKAAEPRRGWIAPAGDVFQSKVLTAAEAARAGVEAEAQAAGEPVAADPNAGNDAAGADEQQTQPAATPDQDAAVRETRFLWRAVGLGYVVAWRDANPFPGDELDWRWLMVSLPEPCTRWTQRHGTWPETSNPQFNELLIADVGLPPIQTYKVLITFFVVLIGPVNYWLLRRYERLHLFLFTVPLAALLATGGLLGYAMMADGLESRLRARSLTVLDQRAAQAASSAWLSYYVGLTPSAGLTFPRETVVTPLELEPAYYLTGNARRRIFWDDQQHLTRGWLPARTPMQLVTERGYPSTRSLLFTSPDAGGERKVTNNLGVRVQELLVCDEAGELLMAGAIEAGKQGSLKNLATEEEQTAATLSFLKRFDQHAPEAPLALDPYAPRRSWRWFGMGRAYYGGQRQSSTYKAGLEARLADLRARISAGDLEPNSYVAIVDRPEEVPAGLDGLTESQSTHVVHGVW